jgi:hypothetical protein
MVKFTLKIRKMLGALVKELNKVYFNIRGEISVI